MRSLKFIILTVLVLTVAGCHKPGLEGMPSATQSAFSDVNPIVPEGWERQVRAGGVIVYGCRIASCKEQGEIAYSAMYGKKNTEAEMRVLLNDAAAMKYMDRMIERFGGNGRKQISFKNLTDAESVKFERVYTLRTDRGTDYYIMHRTIKGNYSRIVSSQAPTLARARQYLKIGLDGVR